LRFSAFVDTSVRKDRPFVGTRDRPGS
jgi:hypothetical protein